MLLWYWYFCSGRIGTRSVRQNVTWNIFWQNFRHTGCRIFISIELFAVRKSHLLRSSFFILVKAWQNQNAIESSFFSCRSRRRIFAELKLLFLKCASGPPPHPFSSSMRSCQATVWVTCGRSFAKLKLSLLQLSRKVYASLPTPQCVAVNEQF